MDQDSSKKTAFVAMKFTDVASRDKRYLVIKDCLEEAGYTAIRADEIRTSGPSAEEVCNLLRDSSLVVLDTSGNSHSVSYELGFCHGVGRVPASTLLLRELNSGDIPFNFRHFRHRAYKNLQELRQVIRDWFGISAPMTNEQVGYALNFTVTGTGAYGAEAAVAVINALKRVKFTGRCEYYAADGFAMGMPSTYVVGLGLNPLRKSHKLNKSWWAAFVSDVETNLSAENGALLHQPDFSEFGTMREIRATMLLRGVVEFNDGLPTMLLHEESSDSWFTGQIKRQLNA